MNKSIIKHLSVLFAAVTLFLGVLTPISAVDYGSWTSSKSMSATSLDGNKQTTVTMTLPSAEYQKKMDVVFVLDKSQTANEAPKKIKDAAAKMIAILAGYQNIDVKVGVVISQGDPIVSLKLTELNENSSAEIAKSVEFAEGHNASNQHGALILADQMLTADTEVSDDNKFVIMVTDGLGYYWNSEDGKEVYTIGYYSPDDQTGAYIISPSQEVCKSSLPTFEEIYNRTGKCAYSDANWSQLDIYGRLDDGTLNRGGNVNDANQPDSITSDNFSSDWDNYPTGLEKSINLTAHKYADMAEKYHMFNLYWSFGTTGFYPLGEEFMKWTNTIDNSRAFDITTATDEQILSVFSQIKDSLIYVLDKGTVSNTVGTDYSLITSAEVPFSMTKNGVKLTGTKTAENTYSFDNGNYVVTYDPDTKSFAWQINTPVSVTEPVSLSYNLLLNATVTGNYPVANKAVLDSTDSIGNVSAISDAFTIPVLPYTVAPVVVPPVVNPPVVPAVVTPVNYTVNFVDYNGTVLKTQTVAAGGNAVAPVDPTRANDDTYTYTFDSWDKAYTNVQSDLTVTAVYKKIGQTVIIEPNAVPEAGLPALTLLDLASMIVSLASFVMVLFIKKKKDDEDEDENEKTEEVKTEDSDEDEDQKKSKKWIGKLVVAALGVANTIIFFVTQPLVWRFRWVDQYTVIMVIVALAGVLGILFTNHNKKSDKEENDTASVNQ